MMPNKRRAADKSYRPIAMAAVTAIALILGPVATAQPADSGAAIIGLWDTGVEGGKVQISRCGASYCGKLVDATGLRRNPDLRDENNRSANLRSRKLKNLVVLEAVQGGPTRYKGGRAYDPESGDTAHRTELKLLPSDKLEVKGCVAFFCRTKIWTRIRT